jgi:hypothetical protein
MQPVRKHRLRGQRARGALGLTLLLATSAFSMQSLPMHVHARLVHHICTHAYMLRSSRARCAFSRERCASRHLSATYHSSPSGHTSELNLHMQTEIVPRAMRALTRALRLAKPVVGNLKLPRQCAKVWNSSNKCQTVGLPCGGSLPEPVSADLFGDYECALVTSLVAESFDRVMLM